MKLTLDTTAGTLVQEDCQGLRTLDLYSREAFEIISQHWVRLGWNQKYTYTFTWLGRPIIQLPDDLVRLQEVVYRVRPDVILETGVAHGGSLVFHAGLCKAMSHGRVIGVDVEIRPNNREAIESHELASLISLVEGDSVQSSTVRRVRELINPGESVLLVLDADHSREHVMAELEAYHDLVTSGSYIVVADGIMEDLASVPRGEDDWITNNPASAARDFAARHPEFVLEQPAWPFNESALRENVTHWPDAWLRRL